jgi:tight adherence protein C
MEPIYLVPILAFIAVISIGGAVVIASRKSARTRQRLRHVEGSVSDALEKDARALSDTTGFFDWVGRLVAGGGTSSKLRQNLARAGFTDQSAAPVYLGIKMLLLVIACIGAAMIFAVTDLALSMKMLVIAAGGGLLFFIPNIVVDLARRNRSREVRMHLPDAVDLLEVCVSAGMGLDMAWNAVTEEVRTVSTVLADEMTLANLEMQLGSPRAVAMRRMAERTGAEELSSLVAMFVQTERFGTSIAETLRSFATAMRENRSQKAEEVAEKMAVKLLFPMVMFIFPVTLISAVGPAALSIAKMILGN